MLCLDGVVSQAKTEITLSSFLRAITPVIFDVPKSIAAINPDCTIVYIVFELLLPVETINNRFCLLLFQRKVK